MHRRERPRITVEPSSSYGRRRNNRAVWLLIVTALLAYSAISLLGTLAPPRPGVARPAPDTPQAERVTVQVLDVPSYVSVSRTAVSSTVPIAAPEVNTVFAAPSPS